MRLIDADALMRRIEDSARNAGLHSEDYRKIKRFIAITHTIDAEPVRHGRWTDVISDAIHPKEGECSVCKQYFRLAKYYNYCPHCGAKMDAKEEEECRK